MDRILAREGKNAVPATGLAIVGGLIAARIAYIFQHRDAFAYDWWSAFAVWQGGFSAWAGLAVAAGILALRMRPLPAMAKGLATVVVFGAVWRSEEHTSELQSLMRISYAVFCLKKQNNHNYP